ncbi:MAG: amidohydrolase family protein [Acidobacteria bacterium]|nr:amidohydrolase family protein [Acidobacteriota bacterium]
MRFISVLTLLLLCLTVTSSQISPSRPVQPVVFQNVTVIDMESGLAIPGLSVVVEGNRISAVAKTPRIPEKAQVIDATGKFLIPGMWDMHSHSLDRWAWSSLLNIANGVTGVRDPGAIMPSGEITKLRDDVEQGKVFGPRFVASGRQFDGSPKSRASYIETNTADEIRNEIKKRKEFGMDFIKIYTRLSREVFFAAADETKRSGIPLDGHVPLSLTAVEASDAGMRSIEHSYRHRMACATAETEIREILLKQFNLGNDDPKAYWLNEEKAFLLGLNTYSSEKCVELGKKFARNGTWFVPTLVEMQTRFRNEYWEGPEFSERFKDPRLRFVPKAKLQTWRENIQWDVGFVSGQMVYGNRGEDAILSERRREFANRIKMPADLHRGGAKILAGTDADSNFAFLFFGFSLHDELELLVKGGLSPLEALRSATLNPAIFLKREKELGTIEAGKLADLVLLDANPLEDIRNTKKINAVVVNGKYLPKAELDKLLEDAESIVMKL